TPATPWSGSRTPLGCRSPASPASPASPEPPSPGSSMPDWSAQGWGTVAVVLFVVAGLLLALFPVAWAVGWLHDHKPARPHAGPALGQEVHREYPAPIAHPMTPASRATPEPLASPRFPDLSEAPASRTTLARLVTLREAVDLEMVPLS